MLALLDVRTLLVTCAIVFAGVTLALTFVWRQTRSMAGLGEFALAHGLTVAAAVLIGSRAGPDFLSVVVGNTLLILAVGLLHEGTRLFFGLPAPRRLTLAVVAVAALAFACFLYVAPSTAARTLVYCGIQATLFMHVAWLTLRFGRREQAGLSILLMSLALAAQGGILTLRFALTLATERSLDSGLTALALLVALISPVGWAIGLVTTISQRLMQSMRESRDLFEQLVQVARATSEGPSLHATLHGTLEIANKLTGAAASSLMLADETGRITHALHTRGASVATLAPPQSGRLMREGLAGWVSRQRQAALVPDTLEDERWVQMTPRDLPARSALAVPISSGESLLGVLTLVHADPGHFTEEHRRLMDAATTQIALALRNAQISDTRLRFATRQSLLYDVLRAASGLRDGSEIAEAAAQAIVRRTLFTHVVVALPTAGGVWRLHGHSAGLAGAHLPLAAGVLGRAFATGRTQVVPDVSQDPEYSAGSERIRSELAVPLRYADRTLGVLNLESDTLNAFGPDEVQLAESLAEAITLGLENARLYRETSAQSARLTAVIESSRDGLLLVGHDARLLLVNEPGLRRLSLAGRPADWIGQPVDALVEALAPDAPDAAVVLRPLGRPASEAPSEGEWALGGSVLEWLNLPVPLVGRLLVLRDVTQERRAERMREMLTHTMVHDLRSPVAGVLGALELLATTPGLGHRETDLLRLAHDNARRQVVLINAILDVSRLEQGTVPLERQPVALPDLVADVLRLSAPRAAGKKVELQAETPPGLPAAWLDRDLIARVVENLVANALMFSPAGGSVRVSVEPDGGSGVRVAVRDEGPGVSPDLRPRLFQKFAPGGHRGHGSGLGLFFCRLAVEAHGGRIWLDDPAATTGGATFVFTLPDAFAARA